MQVSPIPIRADSPRSTTKLKGCSSSRYDGRPGGRYDYRKQIAIDNSQLANYVSHMATEQYASESTTKYLARPDGRIGYDVQGDGPLVLLVPGMGELRSSYRFLAPALVAAGYTVVTTDLRGHGDSDTSFTHYGDVETAGDIEALLQELGQPAVVVGNSLAAGAAVIVDAEHPELVDGLVLIGPFVRNPPANAFGQAMFRVLMAPLWVAAVWKAYMPTLYAGQKPVDFAQYRESVQASLRRPAYGKAFSQTTRQTDHALAEARLVDVTAPVLVVMGSRDPDFNDPAGEARWIGDTLHADIVMVPESGHYPQSQQPQITADAVLAFLKTGVHHA
jgi:pimeloyl-ACP methyl ester carboxylesterase